MADKFTNERSQLSESIGLHEIYLGDELTRDFIKHGDDEVGAYSSSWQPETRKKEVPTPAYQVGTFR